MNRSFPLLTLVVALPAALFACMPSESHAEEAPKHDAIPKAGDTNGANARPPGTAPSGDDSGLSVGATNPQTPSGQPDPTAPPTKRVAAAARGDEIGDVAKCHQAWLGSEASRPPAARIGDPFASLQPGQSLWGRAVTADSVLYVLRPAEYDVFKAAADTECAVPTAWTVRYARISLGVHPAYRHFETVYVAGATPGEINKGDVCYGGFCTLFASTLTPYEPSLMWSLYAEDAPAPSEVDLRARFGLQSNAAITVSPLRWGDDFEQATFAVSFGESAKLEDRTMWGLAGKQAREALKTGPPPSPSIGNFGSRSDEALGSKEFFGKYPNVPVRLARAWDATNRKLADCTPNDEAPFGGRCNGIFANEIELLRRKTLAQGKDICATILWRESVADDVIATSACITPTGSLEGATTVNVKRDTLGLPSTSEVDALLPSDQLGL